MATLSLLPHLLAIERQVADAACAQKRMRAEAVIAPIVVLVRGEHEIQIAAILDLSRQTDAIRHLTRDPQVDAYLTIFDSLFIGFDVDVAPTLALQTVFASRDRTAARRSAYTYTTGPLTGAVFGVTVVSETLSSMWAVW